MLRAVSFADNVPQSDSLRQCRIAYVIASWPYFYFVLIFFAGSWSRKTGSLWEVTGGTNHCSIFCSFRKHRYKNCKATSSIKIPSIRINIWHSWWIIICWNLRGTHKQRCGRMLNLKLCLFVSHFYLKADRWPAKIIVLSSQKHQPLTAKNFPFMTIK